MRAEHPAERPDRQGTREVEAAVAGVGQSLQVLSDPLVMVPRAPCGGQGRVAAGTARQERPLRGDEHLEEDAARPERHGEQDQQLWLFSDRASAHIMRANQLRMYFSAFAGAIGRRVGLRGTLRSRLFKLAGRLNRTVRRIRLCLTSTFPLQDVFARTLVNLRAAAQAPPG